MSTSRRELFMEGRLDAREEAELLANDEALALEVRASMYVDGELDPAEAHAFEAGLVASPRLQALVAELSAVDAVAASATAGLGGEERRESSAPARRASSRATGTSAVDRSRAPTWAVRGRALVAAFAAAGAAAAVIVLLVVPTVNRGGGLQVEVRAARTSALRGVSASVGDTLSVTVPVEPEQSWRLRIYHPAVDGLVVECPGDARCVEDRDRLRVEVELNLRGDYDIEWVVSPAAIAPSRGSSAEDASTYGPGTRVIPERVTVH